MPFTRCSIPLLIFPTLCLYFLAYLARKPNTHLLRLMFAPLPIFGSLYVAFGYVLSGDRRFMLYNLAKSVYATCVVIQSIDFAIRSDPIKRVAIIGDQEETKLNRQKAYKSSALPQSSSRSRRLQRKQAKEVAGSHVAAKVITEIRESMYLACAVRGLEYDWGQNAIVAPETRSPEKKAFLYETCQRFVCGFLVVDFIDAIWKLSLQSQTPIDGSVPVRSLHGPMCYFLSVLLQYSSGIMIQTSFQTIYDLNTILAVLVLNQSPKVWPPIFNNPHSQDSLTKFWGVGWHQLFRRGFLIVGGFPGQWIARKLGLEGSVGLLFGTFFASGMGHELPNYFLGLGFDWRVPIYFMQQASGIFLERRWRKVTGRPIGGLVGWIWAHLVLGIFGRYISQSWHSRGFGGFMIVPPSISPTRRIIFPILSYFLVPLTRRFCG
ncbi:hypothetical protein BU17DRAFT_49798 [Hysterangium stoloniferum]|nr:hypothetical protein BU17DRAFT_49798 [Hysterangium stoloniferum]